MIGNLFSNSMPDDYVLDKEVKAADGTEGSQISPCSRQNLYHHPALFPNCTRSSPRPSCSPEQSRQWEAAVKLRYDGLRGKCVTTETVRRFGPSGPGSSLEQTAAVRHVLARVFREHDIRTVVDCPCGDWLWMQHVNLTDMQYFGADITRITVEQNDRCFARPNVHFHHLDWTCSVPPAVDLLLVRDVLFHLSEATALVVLYNIHRSGARFLATTTFSKRGQEQGMWKNNRAYPELRDERLQAGNGVIGFQRINLFAPPYNFPEPLYVAQEEQDRIVGIWKLPLDHIDFPVTPIR